MRATTRAVLRPSTKSKSKPKLKLAGQVPRQTIISLLLDETGSMASIKDDTIGGFNDYVRGLQKQPEAGLLHMTLTKFDSNHYTPVYVGKAIKQVPLLDDQTYQPGASTPLYDAIGKTLEATQAWLDAEKAKGNDPAVLFVIQTDGQENASREWKLLAVKQAIADKTKSGWTFVYLGAGQEAWGNAAAMGIAAGSTSNYAHTGVEHRRATAVLASATASFSAGGSRSTQSFFVDHGGATAAVPPNPPTVAIPSQTSTGGWSDPDPFKKGRPDHKSGSAT